MKPQLIFGVLTIATGLLGGSFTHPAIAKRCCVRPTALRASYGRRCRSVAQIAHRIPPQHNLPHSDRHCLH